MTSTTGQGLGGHLALTLHRSTPRRPGGRRSAEIWNPWCSSKDGRAPEVSKGPEKWTAGQAGPRTHISTKDKSGKGKAVMGPPRACSREFCLIEAKQALAASGCFAVIGCRHVLQLRERHFDGHSGRRHQHWHSYNSCPRRHSRRRTQVAGYLLVLPHFQPILWPTPRLYPRCRDLDTRSTFLFSIHFVTLDGVSLCRYCKPLPLPPSAPSRAPSSPHATSTSHYHRCSNDSDCGKRMDVMFWESSLGPYRLRHKILGWAGAWATGNMQATSSHPYSLNVPRCIDFPHHIVLSRHLDIARQSITHATSWSHAPSTSHVALM